MAQSVVPVLICGQSLATRASRSGKLLTTIATSIGFARPICAVVKSLVVSGDMKRGARPTVASNMETVLMTLCLVLVLKPIPTKGTLVLLFSSVSTSLMSAT